ncbi:RDD family protein [Candidatus Aquarickettsia rohweri]|uniref:RDD family protein n=1 Tax=Candidatus Aquarickettsia rohweri TaxID=2602574 RepID=A0A429XSP1_9RICK|nr:RDD family protein [Candidatus Aquarickettsia rohweri]RST70060.1 RDD family protein [Candidatus Aquarickettsia rohweri]
MNNKIYSGLARRIIATMIDGIVLIIPHLLFFSFEASGGYSFGSSLIHIVINVVYIAYFESSKYQGTIGKILMDIKIVDVNGQTISFSKSILRYLGFCLLSIIGGMFINFFTILFTKEKVAVQDMLFETRVLMR